MPASKKTAVIEWIFFNKKFDAATGLLTDPVVSFTDVVEGIEAAGNGLSARNTANFWKDLTRAGPAGQNRTWPSRVFDLGYTGSDAIGQADSACFMFIPVSDGRAEPFLQGLVFDPQLPVVPLQSLSMPQTMKALGRPGENWHSQVADRLNIVSTFFALCSPRNVPPRAVLEVNFLQTGIKMSRSETDAAFAVVADDGQWLVSAEVKGGAESFHLPQIARAAHSLHQAAKLGQGSALSGIVGVIPLGIKVVAPSKLWVVEFEPVEQADTSLTAVAQGVFELIPHVPGVN